MKRFSDGNNWFENINQRFYDTYNTFDIWLDDNIKKMYAFNDIMPLFGNITSSVDDMIN